MKKWPISILRSSGRYPLIPATRPPTELFNPINAEEWLCANYEDVISVDGVSFITVHRAMFPGRSYIMRKDALRKKLK